MSLLAPLLGLDSWTWSHPIDDSTDLQTLQEPQDNTNTRLDRGNSNFDHRHRLVVSSIFDSPARFSATPAVLALFRDWIRQQLGDCHAKRRPARNISKFPFSERRRGTGPASAGLNGESRKDNL